MPLDENPRYPPPPTLLLVGGSVRAAAASAVRGGFSVWSCDLFGDADLSQLGPACRTSDYPGAYPDGLVTAVATAPSAPLIYTGALENHPQLIQRLADLRPLLGNSARVVQAVRDPLLLAARLRDHGFPTPAIIHTPPDNSDRIGIPSATHSSVRRWLRKPWKSAGGEGINFFPSTGSAPTDAAENRQAHPWYYQEFVPGVPLGAVYIAARGAAVLLGVTTQLIGRRWPQPNGFHYAGSIGPVRLTDEQRATFERLGNCLASEFSLTGLFGVDAILTDDMIYPIEVNPRWTASVELLERAASMSFMPWHVNACVQGALPVRVDSQHQRSEQFGKLIVYAERPFDVRPETTERWLALQQDDWPQFADIPVALQTIPKDAPICTVFAAAPTSSEVKQKLITARQRALSTP